MHRRKIDFSAWMALSSAGYPALFLGLASTRKKLKENYSDRFLGDIEVAGYRLVRVRVQKQEARQ